MSLTNSQRLVTVPFIGTYTEAAAAEVDTGGAEALAITAEAGEGADWLYSATAEGRTGEVAGAEGHDLDGEPGLIYSGPVGGAVRVAVKDLDIAEGSITVPDAEDTVIAAIFLNNDVVAYADEGFLTGPVSATHEFNADTYVGGLVTGDVIRVGLITDAAAEEALDFDVAATGTLSIV